LFLEFGSLLGLLFHVTIFHFLDNATTTSNLLLLVFTFELDELRLENSFLFTQFLGGGETGENLLKDFLSLGVSEVIFHINACEDEDLAQLCSLFAAVGALKQLV